MKRLFYTELLKLMPFRTSWVIAGLFTLLVPLVYGILPNMVPEGVGIDAYTIYNYTRIWNFLPYVSAYFTTLLGILLIISISNDFTYGTLRQNVIDGFSRKDWLGSKYLILLATGLLASGVVLLTGIAYGLLYSDDGSLLSHNPEHLLLYFLQTVGILSFSVLIGIGFQRSGLSIVLFFLYTLILEPTIGFLLPQGWSPYLPISTINNLLPFPVKLDQLNSADFSSDFRLLSDPILSPTFFLALGYTGLFVGVSYLILQRRDL